MTRIAIDLAERGLLPDGVIRRGIRTLLKGTLDELNRASRGDREAYEAAFAERLKATPVAEHTAAANRQHYEVPTRFFETILGPRLKYSACLFENGMSDLGAAEEAMLRLTCERAGLADGQEILELGCGWGSLTLWMAERYPAADITALTNSATQAKYVQDRAREQGFQNVRVLKDDIRDFVPPGRYDRMVSIEMFEHVRNYDALFRRLAEALKEEGRLFVHVFSHRDTPYLFEAEDENDWMGRFFFAGGTMPSHGLLPRMAAGFETERQWRVNGRHYAATLERWLERLDRNRGAVMEICRETYGSRDAKRWLQRWRLFLMGCSELFAFDEGRAWGVSHYMFSRKVASRGHGVME